MIFIKTSVSDEPDWVLSAYGVAGRIEEIAKAAGIETYSITPHHSNLPTGFAVSSSQGVETIAIRATTAAEVEQEIRTGLGIAALVESLPPASASALGKAEVDIVPAPAFEEQIVVPVDDPDLEPKKEVGDGGSRVSHRRGGGD